MVTVCIHDSTFFMQEHRQTARKDCYLQHHVHAKAI